MLDESRSTCALLSIGEVGCFIVKRVGGCVTRVGLFNGLGSLFVSFESGNEGGGEGGGVGGCLVMIVLTDRAGEWAVVGCGIALGRCLSFRLLFECSGWGCGDGTGWSVGSSVVVLSPHAGSVGIRDCVLIQVVRIDLTASPALVRSADTGLVVSSRALVKLLVNVVSSVVLGVMGGAGRCC